MFCQYLYNLLSNDQTLRAPKPTEGSVGRKVSATHSTNYSVVGDLIDTVCMCDCSFHHLYRELSRNECSM